MSIKEVYIVQALMERTYLCKNKYAIKCFQRKGLYGQ